MAAPTADESSIVTCSTGIPHVSFSVGVVIDVVSPIIVRSMWGRVMTCVGLDLVVLPAAGVVWLGVVYRRIVATRQSGTWNDHKGNAIHYIDLRFSHSFEMCWCLYIPVRKYLTKYIIIHCRFTIKSYPFLSVNTIPAHVLLTHIFLNMKICNILLKFI